MDISDFHARLHSCMWVWQCMFLLLRLHCIFNLSVHRGCTPHVHSPVILSRELQITQHWGSKYAENLLQFTRLLRDALYDNIEAFCCFSKANRLVLSLFFPSCARPLSAFDWQSCRSRGRRYRWNEGKEGNKMQNKEQREQEHCSDLKLVCLLPI